MPSLTNSGRLVALTMITLIVVAPNTDAQELPTRPNILFILADDLGYGDLGCYGQTKIATPNIDRLAAAGLRFTDFYAGATICSPSRCVLMTGLHTGHARIRGNMATAGGILGRKGDRPVRRMNLTADDRTVADVLGAAGYRTGIVGKWHLDGFEPTAGPMDRGFEEFHGWLVSEPSTYGSTYFPTRRFRDRQLVAVPPNLGGRRGAYHADLCRDEAVAFLEGNRDRPFFLFLSFNLPHSPLDVPDLVPYADKNWPAEMKTYAAMVHRLDQSVGSVLQTVQRLGLDDRTIVFFCSDNGPRSEPTDELTRVAEFFDSNGPLGGYKRDMTDGGIRVPMIVRWPGVVPLDTRTDVSAHFADVLPTLAELSGAKIPDKLDGTSLAPTLRGETQELADRFLYWEDFERSFRQAVRWRHWKAIRPRLGAALELFDLSTDPGEEHDVAAEHPQVVDRIEAYLATARTESENWPLDPRGRGN